MASENETVAEVVGLMRDKGYYRGFMGITNPLTDRMVSSLLDRIESAHKREVAELKRKLELTRQQRNRARLDAQEKIGSDVIKLRREVSELTAIISAECRKCGECAKFGKDCDAGDVDGAEDRRACEKFVSREVAELRECLKEAVEWSCGNPDDACEDCVAHGGDTPCKCEKWRKALEGENHES